MRLALLGVAALGTAHAEEQALTVRLGGSCMPPGTSVAEVLRILEAELSPARVVTLTSDEAPGNADAVLAVDGCTDSPPGARVSVWRHEERRERFVSLADAARGSLDRTLSLAMAEALRDPTTTQPTPTTWQPAPLRVAPPTDQDANVSERRSTTLAPRASALVRFMPTSSTLALGVDAAVEWGRVATGLTVLAARQSESLGTATLIAIAGSASLDVVDLGAVATARVAGELGAAIGYGSPNAAAAGHTQSAIHLGLLGGVASTWAVGMGYAVEGFIGAGYASSLNADADGRHLGSLGGAIAAAMIGVRLP